MGLQPLEWTRVIKTVKLVLNNSPSPLLRGLVRITAMDCLNAMDPSNHIAVPRPAKAKALNVPSEKTL
ncbi:hypothetical protein PHMEG_0004553 [Phytophthora megakarya]|uniref:Uncharacterized protein n=1 Tax=Phytophthora megakarya TaxID=4795 RepID=A0A225WV74_9STRA|nr:hypothetical protein PHMEG_0004553 [Phytophthora megakarya]